LGVRLAAILALAVSSALLVDYTSAIPTFCGVDSGCAAVRRSGFGFVPIAGQYVPLPVFGVLAFALLLGIALTPKGVFDRGVVKTLLLAMVSGAAMALVAYLCKSITPWVVAPLSLVAYVVAALVTGAIEKEQLAAGKAFVQRKLSRGR